MAFVHGSTGRLFANQYAISDTIAGWNFSHTRNASEVTTIADTGARFVPGLMSGQVTLRGPQDSVGRSLHAVLEAAKGSDNSLLITACPYGIAIGTFALTTLADIGEHAIDAAVADAVGFSASAMSDESVDMGFIVHALGAETVDGNGTSVDRLASSANGAVAVLHATAYSGLTNAAIKIQHSTDNSAWSDLVSFTTITAIGAERKLVAAATTVNRYVRVVTDVTGTGSVTFLVTLAPR